jgi:hypothetical protein
MRRRAGLCAITIGCALVGTIGGADLAAAAVIEKPRSGQTVRAHPVKLVVGAGPEYGDLKARLNGVRIGELFRRKPGNERVLSASASHGLRRGRNVLRVAARIGSRVRRETVRFTVAHHRHMADAGRDRRVGVGARLKLSGDVDRDRRGAPIAARRWKLVGTPRRSRLAVGSRLARGGRGAATALSSFRPDVLGHYTLQFKVAAGPSSTTDSVTIDAVPENQLVEVDTAVEKDGASPWGIRVGDQSFPAPPMRSAGGQSTFVGSSTLWTHYASLWQVVVLDRANLGFKSNTTYGWCTGTPGTGFCLKGENGEPALVPGEGGQPDGSAGALKQRLADLGQERVVVATNHYDADQAWGHPDTGQFATGALSEIGFPASSPAGLGADNASAAVVGVPGMPPGDADYLVIGNGARMHGYLSPDPLNHFGFLPASRESFDTRTASGCGSTDPNQCGVDQAVAGHKISGTLQSGEGGYLVSAFDGHDLEPAGSQLFETAGGGDAARFRENAQAMTKFLADANSDGYLVLVTSVRTPGLGQNPLASAGIDKATWVALADAVKGAGGTRHAFNNAASPPGSDYTLIGRGGAGEGNGDEEVGADARLAGALVPDNASVFRPLGVISEGAPAEALNKLVVQAPSEEWALGAATDAGARRAFSYIGNKAGMTTNPRAAYAQSLHTEDDAQLKLDLVDGVDMPRDAEFTDAEFTTAKAQLKRELTQVANVRLYLERLASPGTAAGHEAWEDASILADRIQGDLAARDAAAKLSFDPFTLVVALLNFAGAAAGDPELGTMIKVLAGSTQSAKVLFEANYAGSSPTPSSPQISADDLAKTLEDDAKQTQLSYLRMGDVIVTDPRKLEVVGTYGNCTSPCDVGYDEYSTDSLEPAAAMASRALDRTLYGSLVPLSYPVWDTSIPNGTTRNPDTSMPFDGTQPLWGAAAFTCTDSYTPFYVSDVGGADERTYSKTLLELDPTGADTRWTVMIMVHRQRSLYSWPDGTILSRMFGPVSTSTNPDDGGLAIDRADLTREAWANESSRYVPGRSCTWQDATGRQ